MQRKNQTSKIIKNYFVFTKNKKTSVKMFRNDNDNKFTEHFNKYLLKQYNTK